MAEAAQGFERALYHLMRPCAAKLRHESHPAGIVVDGSEIPSHVTLCILCGAGKYNQEFRWQQCIFWGGSVSTYLLHRKAFG
jgi:hypothetical protein